MSDKSASIKIVLSEAFEEKASDEVETLNEIACWTDNHLLEGNFEEVDEVFKVLEEDFLDECLNHCLVPIDLLMVSNGSKEDKQKMSYRDSFIESFKEKIDEDGEEDPERLLSGFD